MYNAGINSGKENARTSVRTLVVQAYYMDETLRSIHSHVLFLEL